MKQRLLFSISFIICFGCTYLPENSKTTGGTAACNAIPSHAVPVFYYDYLHLKLKIDSAEGSFIFDTGFDNLCIDSIFYNLSKMNYLSSSSGKIYGIGNAYQELNLIRDTICFSMDSRTFRTSNVPVLNLKPIGGDYIDGLLGTRHFAGEIVEVTYTKGYLKVHDSIDSVDVTGYSLIPMINSDFHFFIPATLKINDSVTITGNFLLDTATPESSLTSYIAYKNDLSEKVDKKVLYYTMYGGIGGESSGYDFSAVSLMIGGLTLPDVIFSYSLDTAGSLASEDYIGILGNNILDRFDLIIDFRLNNLYLRPNERYDKPFEFNRMGFAFVDRCKTMGGWIVSGMYRNSPAEKEGLMIDDKIITINKTPVEKIPYEEQEEYFEKIRRVTLEVSRQGNLHTIEFALAPLRDT